MQQLNKMLGDILAYGDNKDDRTGTGTLSLFGDMSRFSLAGHQWPIPTSRAVAHEKINRELKWFLSGSTHVGYLVENNVNIWNSWAGEDGTIGPMYGEQWRNWTTGLQGLSENDKQQLATELRDQCYGIDPGVGYTLTPELAMEALNKFLAKKNTPYAEGGRGGIDQLSNIVHTLRTNPNCRRMVVSTWNTPFIPDSSISPDANVDAGRMALAPCHTLWQVRTAELSEYEILKASLMDGEFGRTLLDIDMQSLGPMGLDHHIAMGIRREILHKYFTIDPRFVRPGSEKEALTPLGEKTLSKWINEGKPTRKLSLMLYARSQDVPLGTVWNIGMYAMLTKFLAQITNMLPHEYIHVSGDYHIYKNQIECVMEQIKRPLLRPARAYLPPYWTEVDDFNPEEITVDYVSHPAIKFPRAAI